MNTRRDVLCGLAASSLPMIGKTAPIKAMLGSRDSFLTNSEIAPTPYAYRIEYLDATQSTRMPTGIIASNGIIISGEALQRNANSVCGWDDANCMTNNLEFRWRYNSISVSAPQGTKFSFSWGPQIYFNGEFVGNRSLSPVSPKEVYLFDRNGGDNLRGRIYWINIENENGLVRAFIPVVDSNGTPCMFDRISKGFFYDANNRGYNAGPKI